MKNLISPSELSLLLKEKNVILLDASLDGKAAGLATKFPNKKIDSARFFDIKNTFSNTNSGLPNTFPSKDQFEREAQKLGINNESTIVVYDNIGLFSSPRAWWMFKTMGHENVKVLDGGLPAWIEDGYEVVDKKDEPNYSPGNFKAQLNPEKVRYMDDIVQNISTNQECVVDARGKQRFDGSVEEPRPGMQSGHIPNSFNIPFKEVLEQGKLKDPKALKSIFGSILNTDKKLVFTCGSGITAAILHLAASEVLDNDMAIYDGSWSEWGQSNHPISKS